MSCGSSVVLALASPVVQVDVMLAAFDISVEFRHLFEVLVLLLQPFIWIGLCVGFVLASAHMLTMLVTHWGDRRVSGKALMLSIGMHVMLGLAVLATVPLRAGHTFGGAVGEPIGTEVRLEISSSLPTSDRPALANAPAAWDVIAPQSVGIRERTTTLANRSSSNAQLVVESPVIRPAVDELPEQSTRQDQSPLPTAIAMAPTIPTLAEAAVQPTVPAPRSDITLAEPEAVLTAPAAGEASAAVTIGRPTRERSTVPSTGAMDSGASVAAIRPSTGAASGISGLVGMQRPDAGLPRGTVTDPRIGSSLVESPPIGGAATGSGASGAGGAGGNGMRLGAGPLTAITLPQNFELDLDPLQTPAMPADSVPGTVLRRGRESPYAIEIWVKKGNDYEPRQISYEDGRAFVSLAKGEIYAVRIINESKYDASVAIYIDGVSMFAYSEGNRHSGLVLTTDMKAALIKGWYRTNDTSEAFRIVDPDEIGDLNAAQQSPGEFGSVTVTYSAAWEHGKSPPPDESAYRTGSARPGASTERGPSVAQRYEPVRRHVGAVRDTLTVFYRK